MTGPEIGYHYKEVLFEIELPQALLQYLMEMSTRGLIDVSKFRAAINPDVRVVAEDSVILVDDVLRE